MYIIATILCALGVMFGASAQAGDDSVLSEHRPRLVVGGDWGKVPRKARVAIVKEIAAAHGLSQIYLDSCLTAFARDEPQRQYDFNDALRICIGASHK